ncbi:MAG: AraC family transcriptional regulator [Asticcacaulis sp.]
MLGVVAPAVATAQLMLALLLWRHTRLEGRADMAVALGLGALYFLHAAFPDQLRVLLPVIAVGPLAFNRAIRAGLGMRQRPDRVDMTLCAVLVGLSCAGLWPGHIGGARYGWDAISLYLFLELPVMVWRGLPDDLLAGRRRARYVLLGLGVVTGAGVAAASVAGWTAQAAASGAVLTLGLCIAAVAVGGEGLKRLTPSVDQQALDAQEQRQLQRLRTEMAQAYSDPELSLSRLAQRLNLPEHRLRRLIHIGEGHGHFSGYLNRYRIEAFKAKATEPGTILEQALAVGYNSLSVFNRAFKASEGMTPTAFRAALKAKTSPANANPPEMTSGQ